MNPYVKRCGDCQRQRPLGQFPRSGTGRAARCRECEAARRRRRTSSAKRAERDARLRRLYGITAEDYDRMGRQQRWRCAICGRPPYPKGARLVVDHCHKTGRVRALLCHTCNTALGLMGDKAERLDAAARYLRRYDGPA